MTEYAFKLWWRDDQDYGTSKSSRTIPTGNNAWTSTERAWYLADFRSYNVTASSADFTSVAVPGGSQDVYTFGFEMSHSISTSSVVSTSGDSDYSSSNTYRNFPHYKLLGDKDARPSPNELGLLEFVRQLEDDKSLFLLRFYHRYIDGSNTEEFIDYVGKIQNMTLEGVPGETFNKYNLSFTFYEDTERI